MTSSSSSSSLLPSGSAPPLPSAPRPLKVSPPPSHAAFLLEQTRASLRHLHVSGALDVITYRDVEYKLNKAVLREPEVSVSSETPTGLFGERNDDSEEVKLGKKNAWLRKAISETSLLPSLVETALNIVGGPFLGDTQIDAIVELVEMSQSKIGDAITNPRNQQTASTAAFSGIKEGSSRINKGFAAANNSLVEMNKRRAEKALKAKAEKQERKAIEAELKQEREEIRQRTESSSVAAQSNKGDAAPLKRPVSSETSTRDDSSTYVLLGGSDTNSTAQSGTAVADVAVAMLGSSSSAATTTFRPWPGVLISSTIVAAPKSVEEQASASRRMLNSYSQSSEATLPPLATSPRSLSAASLSANPYSDATQPSDGPSDRQASLGLRTQQTMTEADEAKLRSRQPPPLPQAASNDAETPLPAQTPPSSLPPPPQHRSRPAIGERQLSERDRAELQPAPNTAGPSDLDNGGENDELVDVTERKRKGWKNKLLG